MTSALSRASSPPDPPTDFAGLVHLPASLHIAARRMIAVSGMADLAVDIAGTFDLPQAVRGALAAGRPVLCDCEMVRSAIAASGTVSADKLLCFLKDSRVPDLAKTLGNTRSAAAVDLWGERLGGAVVVVGNAPTALFRLYELLADGAPRPAAIIGIPVGFVGAAESKALLAQGIFGGPYLMVRGRRGGSAMAAAAFLALAETP